MLLSVRRACIVCGSIILLCSPAPLLALCIKKVIIESIVVSMLMIVSRQGREASGPGLYIDISNVLKFLSPVKGLS
jgi:hypothetical protein